MLRVTWNETLGEIQVRVMGAVQIEILKSIIRERFGIDVEFGDGHVVYKETITAPTEGVGHYEPLRHYAEVHLLLEPAPRGSGLTFGTVCSTDVLEINWQRLILTHLEEKCHIGVLTGAPVTDMKITLLVGRAHLKHTEGGDFRQATYRAVRHGLMEALTAGNYLLLEPYYRFRLEVPAETAGRAMADLERMSARFSGPEIEEDMAVIVGEAPVASMGNYQMEVASYAKGRGRLHFRLKGYEPCHDTEEAVAEAGYEPEMDLDNPCGSVFCSHGAGFLVDWYAVKNYMHLESPVDLAARRVRAAAEAGAAVSGKTAAGAGAPVSGKATAGARAAVSGKTAAEAGTAGSRRMAAEAGAAVNGKTAAEAGAAVNGKTAAEAGAAVSGKATAGARAAGASEMTDPVSEHSSRQPRSLPASGAPSGNGASAGAARPAVPWGAEDKELEAIFTRTYGERKPRLPSETGARRVVYGRRGQADQEEEQQEYLLVDGYNIIFAWKDLHELADATIDGARHALMDILCNYQGYMGCILILVFDAYKVEGNLGQALRYHNIHVVYTKEAETADQYIEKLAHKMGRSRRVTVATSDGLEQLIIRGQGCRLMSAQDLREAVEAVNEQIRTEHLQQQPVRNGNYLLNHADGGLREYLEKVRLGKEGEYHGGETDKK